MPFLPTPCPFATLLLSSTLRGSKKTEPQQKGRKIRRGGACGERGCIGRKGRGGGGGSCLGVPVYPRQSFFPSGDWFFFPVAFSFSVFCLGCILQGLLVKYQMRLKEKKKVGQHFFSILSFVGNEEVSGRAVPYHLYGREGGGGVEGSRK
eukprot:Sspe_Gene.7955::Locus_2695_Transcript_1_1_Confidence_1.000_Length_646::g.7955::m.7955